MNRRSFMVRWSGAVSAACLILGVLAGCGGRDEETATSAKTAPEHHPAVVDLLELMPESAVTAIATPSVREFGDSVEGFLLRASPDSINMEAEIRVVIQQMGRAIGVPDAHHLDDIAFEYAVDPERPAALFVGTSLPKPIRGEVSEGEPEPSLGSSNERDRLTPADNNDAEFAIVAYTLDPAETERAILRFLDDAELYPDPVQINGIPMHFTKDLQWCYFLHDDMAAFGTYALVQMIPRHINSSAPVRYGTADCPSDPNDRLVQLTRFDRFDRTMPVVSEAEADLPPEVSESVSGVLRNMQTLFQGNDPMITVYRVADDSINVVTRLDRHRYPALADWRGPGHGLSHLAMLPDDTVSTLSWDFDGTMRDLIVNAIKSPLAAESKTDQPAAPMFASMGALVDLVRGNITIAVVKPDAGDPALLVLADVADGDNARTQLRASGLMPLVSETYNGTDICLLPVPVPIGDGLCYALPGNTFVLSTDLGRLKTAIDSIEGSRTTNWAANQEPALDPHAPTFTALLIKPHPLSEALLPQLESQHAVDAGDMATAKLVWEHIREVRFTTSINGIWQEGHLRVTTD